MGWAANGAVYEEVDGRLPYTSPTPTDLCISHVYSVSSGLIPSPILATARRVPLSVAPTPTLNQWRIDSRSSRVSRASA
ncbi:hypothetical protein R3P38DRAFT_3267585 [Favolaschia claudopus]|uniref:Uncharacterized protein n=1 Tax=Favolaschia claudopus TaxID=2862362 RepID=A0AAW0BRS6_9AGAR